jgi:RNA polymerase sigma-70 factor (ECF subfamily)
VTERLSKEQGGEPTGESRRLLSHAGDDPRFRSVLENYAPALLRFLELRTGNHSDALDLAQEAYFRLCRIRNPDLIREPEAYLFRIAFNLLGEFRLRSRTGPSAVELHDELTELRQGDDGSFCAHLEHRSEMEKLDAIISGLPPLYQAVLLLRKRDGLSHEEIAEQLSISPHTVHKYLTRALLRCRVDWAEKHAD